MDRLHEQGEGEAILQPADPATERQPKPESDPASRLTPEERAAALAAIDEVIEQLEEEIRFWQGYESEDLGDAYDPYDARPSWQHARERLNYIPQKIARLKAERTRLAHAED